MTGILRKGLAALRSALAGERGNVAIITALLLPVLVGGFGMGFETAGWYQTQRAMQNAADSAAVAAATNASSSYAAEADAVTAKYGFTNGSAGVVVTPSNSATCPSGGATCYSVTITKPVPLYLMQVLGFHGDTTLNGAYAEQMTATAIAGPGQVPVNFCLLALASSGATGITSNGAPFTNLNGCDVMSNTNATCNGHNLNADYGIAHGTSTGCGTVQISNAATVADPYSGLASDIPTNTCTGTTPTGVATAYPQEPVKKKDPPLPDVATTDTGYTGTACTSGGQSVQTHWGWTPSGSTTLPSVVFAEGDVQLGGNWNVTTPAGGTTLVIVNGQLDIPSGDTLQTQAGSGLTIIFTSDAADYGNSTYTHAPTDGGTLDAAAPTSGTWSGVLMYQDPNLTAGINIAAAGNSPTWDLTGLVYLPHSSVTFSGAVNKSTNGYSCFDLVVDNITINGTGSILDEGQCKQAGLTQPTANVPGRATLVA